MRRPRNKAFQGLDTVGLLRWDDLGEGPGFVEECLPVCELGDDGCYGVEACDVEGYVADSEGFSTV